VSEQLWISIITLAALLAKEYFDRERVAAANEERRKLAAAVEELRLRNLAEITAAKALADAESRQRARPG